ncbi:hypothetical protein FWH13_02770 [Candidatus Saccharibacteria bacterium]|nr:hypothetical protein [Candidatus Saccharibacteria bacterium]
MIMISRTTLISYLDLLGSDMVLRMLGLDKNWGCRDEYTVPKEGLTALDNLKVNVPETRKPQ